MTIVLQVLLRYVFKHPLFGLEEFSRLVAVWVYFIGAIFGTRFDSHVQGDVAARIFSKFRLMITLCSIINLIMCSRMDKLETAARQDLAETLL